MASVPGFDPNRFNRFPAEARRNRAIADAYEPGSTFKIVTGSIALEEQRRLASTNDRHRRRHDPGGRNTTISEARRHRYGPLTLAGIFEHSSNVGIIRVGMRLGPARLFEGASAFGVGRPTGVDLPGENAGLFRPLAALVGPLGASISMGQEVSVTALQLARIVAVVANGGLLVIAARRAPRSSCRTAASSRPATPPPVRGSSPRRRRQRCAGSSSGVVERGTGTPAAIPGFTVAGKTGTAQKAGPGGYQPGRYVPNFVGFVPAESPRLVGVVILEEPQGQVLRARTSRLPSFRELSRRPSRSSGLRPRSSECPPPCSPPPRAPFSPPASFRPPRGRSRARRSAVAAGAPAPDGDSRRRAGSRRGRRWRSSRAWGFRSRLEGSGFVVEQQPAGRRRPGGRAPS